MIPALRFRRTANCDHIPLRGGFLRRLNQPVRKWHLTVGMSPNSATQCSIAATQAQRDVNYRARIFIVATHAWEIVRSFLRGQPVDLGPKAPLRPSRSSGESAVFLPSSFGRMAERKGINGNPDSRPVVRTFCSERDRPLARYFYREQKGTPPIEVLPATRYCL